MSALVHTAAVLSLVGHEQRLQFGDDRRYGLYRQDLMERRDPVGPKSAGGWFAAHPCEPSVAVRRLDPAKRGGEDLRRRHRFHNPVFFGHCNAAHLPSPPVRIFPAQCRVDNGRGFHTFVILGAGAYSKTTKKCAHWQGTNTIPPWLYLNGTQSSALPKVITTFQTLDRRVAAPRHALSAAVAPCTSGRRATLPKPVTTSSQLSGPTCRGAIVAAAALYSDSRPGIDGCLRRDAAPATARKAAPVGYMIWSATGTNFHRVRSRDFLNAPRGRAAPRPFGAARLSQPRCGVAAVRGN